MGTFSKAFKGISKLATAMKQVDTNNDEVSSGICVAVGNETIDVKKITNIYMEDLPFIYMPTYIEKPGDSKLKSIVEITGDYKPFAAIVNTNNKSLESLFESNDASLTCVNTNGKKFLTSATGFPCEIKRLNGQVEKNTIFGIEYLDNNSHRNDIKVKNIPSLIIEADKTYYYFGEGINYEDINKEYNELVKKVEELNNTSTYKPIENNSMDDRLAKLKDLYDKKLIPEDEYKKKVEQILNSL